MMWPVVPLCDKQLLGISPENVLFGGYFRKCDVYKGGGGYDKFPAVCKKRLGVYCKNQFVVQLRGCPLKCPYCYVTKDGIWGESKFFSSRELIDHFKDSKQDVFHLMGGAPGLYIEHWHEILDLLPSDKVFHSDLLLVEKPYSAEHLQSINRPNALYVVSIKGSNEKEFYDNTGTVLNTDLFWSNLKAVVSSGINFYFTFTNPSSLTEGFKKNLLKLYGSSVIRDCFNIELVKYKALGLKEQ